MSTSADHTSRSSEIIEGPTIASLVSNITIVEPIVQSIEGAGVRNLELDNKSHGGTESLEIVVDQSYTDVTTGLSFFQSPEELEAMSSAESTYLSIDQSISSRKTRPFSDPGPPTNRPASAIEGDSGATAESLTLSTPQTVSKCDSTPSTDSGPDKHLSEGRTVEGLESVEVVVTLATQEQVDRDSGCSIESHVSLKEQEQTESEGDQQQQQQPGHQQSCLSENDMADVKCSSAVAPSDYAIPPFYFPMGKPLAAPKRRERLLVALVGWNGMLTSV